MIVLTIDGKRRAIDHTAIKMIEEVEPKSADRSKPGSFLTVEGVDEHVRVDQSLDEIVRLVDIARLADRVPATKDELVLAKRDAETTAKIKELFSRAATNDQIAIDELRKMDLTGSELGRLTKAEINTLNFSSLCQLVQFSNCHPNHSDGVLVAPSGWRTVH